MWEGVQGQWGLEVDREGQGEQGIFERHVSGNQKSNGASSTGLLVVIKSLMQTPEVNKA